MGSTIDEVGYIYEQAKELMTEREQDYEGSWRREGMEAAIGALYKKASQIQTMFRNGRWKENIPRFKEDCLDGQNYSVFCSRFIDIEISKQE